MSLRNLIVIAVAAACCAAVPALASEPSSGTVSIASPEVSWNGSVVGPVFTFATIFQSDGTTCAPPSCDQFALKVADGGLDLTVSVTSADSEITTLVIEKPDGSAVYADGIDPDGKPNNTTAMKIKKAPAGDYTVDVGVDTAATATYSGEATLAVPAAPAPAAPAPTPSQPAQAAPSATLTLKTTKLSARKAGKAAKLTLAASKPVTAVQAVIKRGKHVVAKASAAKINGKATLKFKLAKRLKPGSYVFAASARDGAATVGVRAKLKVTR